MSTLLLSLVACIFLSSLSDAVVPTYSPTSVPTPVVETKTEALPIALHQLVVVNTAGNTLIRLKSFSEGSSRNLIYSVESVPDSGSLYQLSQVFSDYGYEPKAGSLISSSNVVVSGSNNRVYYVRPSPDSSTTGKWTEFTFHVKSGSITSYPGTITIVPPSGNLVGSDFLLSTEEWVIEGNKENRATPSYEPYSRGALLNRYVLGVEDKVNVPRTGASDQSLWYFVAPSKFYGNYGISYGGTLQFTLSSFSGDFTKLNDISTSVVELECAECEGPVGKGITLFYSMAELAKSPNGLFKGGSLKISISLKEGVGWIKDPQNTLLSGITASKCDVIQVLSRLSHIKILGDWTTWYESIALDDVRIFNTKGQLPLCAMSRPDASICTC